MLLQEHIKYKKPTSLFEHFIIAGLHPDANLEVVEDAFVKNKKWESEMANSELLDFKMLHPRASSVPTLEPQVDYLIESFSHSFFSILNNIRSDMYWVMLILAHLCLHDLFITSILARKREKKETF